MYVCLVCVCVRGREDAPGSEDEDGIGTGSRCCPNGGVVELVGFPSRAVGRGGTSSVGGLFQLDLSPESPKAYSGPITEHRGYPSGRGRAVEAAPPVSPHSGLGEVIENIVSANC